MSDARIIHKKASGGERVCRLNHLQHRVWVQYVLSADDYGVLRFSVSGLRHDNPKLEQEPLKRILSALDFVVRTGLVKVFDHQGAQFLWQVDWQDFQGIRYPRATVNPAPSQRELDELATKATRKLFTLHPQYSRQSSDEIAEIVPTPAGAGAARNPHPTSNPSSESSRSSEESARETQTGLARVTPIISGVDQRRHGMHAWCDYERGMCVPMGMHSELKGRLGTPDAHTRLMTWYPTVVARYAGRGIGDDVFVFWRNEFAAWQGSVSEKPSAVIGGKGNASRDAMQRTLAKRAMARGEAL